MMTSPSVFGWPSGKKYYLASSNPLQAQIDRSEPSRGGLAELTSGEGDAPGSKEGARYDENETGALKYIYDTTLHLFSDILSRKINLKNNN